MTLCLAMRYRCTTAALLAWTPALAPARTAQEERYVIFERGGESSVPFDETAAALEAALRPSYLVIRGQMDDAPLPGVDHTPALPLQVLVVNDGKQVQVAQNGPMWRMQLYFGDSGYGAFAKNAGMPGTLVDFIETKRKAVPAEASASGGY